jgi:mono/diheme cytochrome c family protein
VWNIWKFDWVQYNGSVSQPLARNIGESLGVGAVIRMTDNYGNPLPPEHRFDSSVDIENLGTIEHTLQTLRPPRWPEQLLGAIDQAKAAKGRALFVAHCEGCHGPHPVDRAQQLAQAPGKPGPEVEWHIEVIPVEHIGTDPTEANGFMTRHYDLSATGLTQNDLVALLQPQMLRDLARDARYRLSETIDGRAKAGLSTGALPTLLAEYPDPDANEVPSIPHASFLAIAAELAKLPPPPSTNDPWSCDAHCQQVALLADVTSGERQIGKDLAALDIAKLTEGEGLNVLGMMIKRKYFAEHKVPYAQQQCMEGFGTLDLPQQIAGYKPRPLEGVWATPPFLHNGSVPTIYQMLLPPAQRDKSFGVGNRLYDPKHLGFVTTPVDGGFTLDTSIPGNRNTGHAFIATPEQLAAEKADPKGHPLPSGVIGPLLTDEERYAILEYLKVHRDEPATPASFQPPVCGP